MSGFKKMVYNGMYSTKDSDKRAYTNSHISYKGRSIIVDYEHVLHAYDYIPNNVVPVEMYPYDGDIYITYIQLDEKFNKVKIEELIKDLDEALDKENN